MFQKIILISAFCFFTQLAFAQDLSLKGKILVAYFSHSGNTRIVANNIHKSVVSDLFEIKTINPYPQDYEAVKKVAKEEQQSKARPILKDKVGDFKKYDVIFLGYPNWWGTIPMPVATFLLSYNFAGKTIVPFCTHEGSRMGDSEDDIKHLAPQTILLEGLAIRGGSVSRSAEDVKKWLKEIKITK